MSFEVQAKPCSTCIYRKDSPLNIEALEAEIKDPHLEGYFKGYRVCHHSESACCSGFYSRHKDDFTAGQLAQRLGLVRFVNHDNLTGDKHET